MRGADGELWARARDRGQVAASGFSGGGGGCRRVKGQIVVRGLAAIERGQAAPEPEKEGERGRRKVEVHSLVCA